MSHSAFDTLGAAGKLKAAGIEAEQADAIVETMGQSVNQLVTVERFDAGIAVLQAPHRCRTDRTARRDCGDPC